MEGQSREVFISYHTETGGDVVRKICAALEGVGISCWYAPRDVGPNYAQSIVEAIRGCRVFLLVLNEKSNVSAHVLNEINCAFDRFKNHEDITLLPFRIDQCGLSDDIYYYLGRIHIMDGGLPPELLRIQELVDRVSRLLGRESARDISLPGPAAKGDTVTYRIVGSTVYPDSRFVGREAELAAIHEQLEEQENKVFLVGMGGIGKSEIVRMYLKRYAPNYDVMLWLSYERSLCHTLASDTAFPIRGLGRTDFPGDSDEDYFRRKLRILKEIADRRVLLIVDNFDVPDDPDLEAFTGGEYAVIFTTRCHQDSGRLPEIDIRPVADREEQMAMFRAEYTRSSDEKGTACVNEILDQLDGHPLSIRLVASTMQSRRIQPEKMNALLREGASAMAHQNARAADLIFGRLRQVFQLSTLSEEEQYLLKNLSLVPLRGIPVETLFDWCGLDDFDLIDDLIRRSWVIHDPVADEVHLHPLVSDLMAEALEQDPGCCEQFLTNLEKTSESVFNTTWEYKQWLFDMAGSTYDRLPDKHPLKGLTLQARGKMMHHLSLYRDAIGFFREAIPQTEDLLRRLDLYDRIAQCCQLSGDPAGCRDAALEALPLIETPVPDHLAIPYTQLMSRLSESSRDLGEYDAAVSYARRGMEYEHLLPAHSQGWPEYHLARTLYMRGDLDESERVLEQALARFRELGGDWAVSLGSDLLGQVKMAQGELDRALELSLMVWDALLPQLGPEHADMANSLQWRGNIYRAMGDADKARGCYMQSAEIYRKLKCPDRAAQIQKLAEQELQGTILSCKNLF